MKDRHNAMLTSVEKVLSLEDAINVIVQLLGMPHNASVENMYQVYQ